MDDAIRYEEFIGSELVEDSIFYSHIIGGKDETRVYKREKSGCGLPLYVKYQVWQKSDHHLWQIEYFWGPYAGLADDSTYVVNAMYNHFLKNPYAYKRLCEEFTGLIVEINDKIEMYDVNDLESIHSNSFAYIDWGLGQEGLNKKDSLLVINNLTLCQESVNSAETYCLEDAYGYLRGFFACRYNPEWNDTYLEMSLYVKETVPLIPIEGMPYGFMRLTFVPGISDKERYSHEVQEH